MLSLYFFGYVQRRQLRACLRNFSSKSDNLIHKVRGKVEKQIFIDKNLFQTFVLDTYKAFLRKLPERFCPMCGSLSTQVHQKWENYSFLKNFSPAVFWTDRKRLSPIVPKYFRSKSGIFIIHKKTKRKLTKIFYERKTRFWEDCWKFSLKVWKVSARRPNESQKLEFFQHRFLWSFSLGT